MDKVKKALEDLFGFGYSETAIAKSVGSTQPTINRIYNGKQEPGFLLGDAIISFRDLVISKQAA